MVLKKVLGAAKRVAKISLAGPKAVIKHRRKIYAGAAVTGLSLAALAKKSPKTAIKVMVGAAKGLHAVGKFSKKIQNK